MTMGTRNCPRCGTALNASWRGACGACGAPFQEAPVAPAPLQWGNPAPPAQPQAWQGNRPAGPVQQQMRPPMTPAGPVQQQMQEPPAAPPAQPRQAGPWAAPYPAGAPQQQPWTGAQPAPRARSGVNPLIFVLAGLLIVTLVGVVGFVAVNAMSNGGFPAGSVNLDPSSFSCSSTSPVTLTIRLAGSVGGSERVTTTLDGKTWGSVVVSDQFTKQSDGTWLHSDSTILDSCHGPDGQLAAGNHKLQVLDSHNKVLAEGSFTTSD